MPMGGWLGCRMETSAGGVLRVAALVLGSGAVVCVWQARTRWARLGLALGALCLLAAPWWGVGRPGEGAPAWQDVLGGIVLFAALWRVSRGEDRRLLLCGLAVGLVIVSSLRLASSTTGGDCPELLSLASWWLLPATAGLAVAAALDVQSDWEAVGGIALALQGAALLALLVVRQEACGVIWGWDPLVCLWAVGLAAIAVCRLIGGGRGAAWRRVLLLSATVVWGAQAVLCGPMVSWLGYVTGCVVR